MNNATVFVKVLDFGSISFFLPQEDLCGLEE